jgi:hypothetical protein
MSYVVLGINPRTKKPQIYAANIPRDFAKELKPQAETEGWTDVQIAKQEPNENDHSDREVVPHG